MDVLNNQKKVIKTYFRSTLFKTIVYLYLLGIVNVSCIVVFWESNVYIFALYNSRVNTQRLFTVYSNDLLTS